MQIGRFFSLQRGRVGQYLSSRVLVVKTPFRTQAQPLCYFGFDQLSQAQKFTQNLARKGFRFQLQRSTLMPQRFEVHLQGHTDLAKTLAYWDRMSQERQNSVPKANSRALGNPTNSAASNAA